MAVSVLDRNAGDRTVFPTEAAAFARLTPLDGRAFSITDPFWLDRQRANRDASITEALRHLEDWGGLPYLRAAAADGPVPDVRPLNDAHVYKILDSDIFKWIEAVAYESLRTELPHEVERAAHEVIDVIVASQTSDGAVHSWTRVHHVEPLSNWMEGHELYCGGHLIQAGVAWHRATGDRRLLDVAARLADFFRRDQQEVHPSLLPLHPGLEMALIELYRETGQTRFRDQALDYLDRRGRDRFGYWRFAPDHFVDDVPVRQATEIRGHAVMALFLLCGVVDAAVELDDVDLLRAAELQWQDMVDRKLYITGGAGSREHDEAFGNPYELAPDTAYCETCAAVASVMLSWRLLLATGESKYADLIELTLYNGFLSGIAFEGGAYLYVNPLHVRQPGHILSPDGYTHRKDWYECACCPPNAMRLVSTIAQFVATADDTGIQLHQYIAGRLRDERGAASREIVMDTTIPFGEGKVSIRIAQTDGSEWELRVRKPEWAEGVRLEGSWADGDLSPFEDQGYLVLRRKWSATDEVTMMLGMPLRRVVADPLADAFRGQEAILRGPVVFCFEEPGLPNGTDIESLRLPPGMDVEGRLVPSDFAHVPQLELSVQHAARRMEGALYQTKSQPSATPTSDLQVTALPYFAWGNRGACRMKVWLPIGGDQNS